MKTTYLFAFFVLLGLAATAQNTVSPQSEALKQINKLKPSLEKKFKGTMAEPQAVIGDVNGDGLADCILSYVFTPKGGGNMIVGHQCTLFVNTGKGVKNAGNFPDFGFCYAPESISNGTILVHKYTCAPPYSDDLGKEKLVYRKGRVQLVR